MSQKGGVNLRISDGRWPVDRTVCLHETLRECIDIACFSCMIWCNKKGVSSTGILAFTYKSLREHLGKHFCYWMERKMKAQVAGVHEVNMLEINRTVVVCLLTYISFHCTTVVSITIVPSVACQHTEGEYYLLTTTSTY